MGQDASNTQNHKGQQIRYVMLYLHFEPNLMHKLNEQHPLMCTVVWYTSAAQ